MMAATRGSVLIALLLTVSPAGGQSLPQGADNARIAFPVPKSVRVVRDIVYAQYGNRQLKLDLYLPPESPGFRAVPGVLVVRGGAWRTGDKEAFAFIAGQLAQAGFAAASIEYRTSAEARFPAAVYDVKAAVRWMRANASAYGIDGMAIGAMGGSAGGHLVAMLATSAGVADLEGSGGNAEISSEIQAAVSMGCVCNLSWDNASVAEFIGEQRSAHQTEIEAASPITYVSGRSAPLLLMHSRTDPLVPYEQSSEIETLYRRSGAVVELKTVDAPGSHGFWNETRYFPATMRDAIAFFRKELAGAGEPGPH